MIEFVRTEWTKLRTDLVPVIVIALVVALLVGASAFVAGLGIGAFASPLHEHMLQANGTTFYPLGTERGPHIPGGTLALLIVAGACVLTLGLVFLCIWTALIAMPAAVMARRRGA